MITQILTHSDDAKNRLLGEYSETIIFSGLIAILGDRAQDLEDNLWKLYSERQIDTAIGAQLDQIGEIVGRKRGGLSDADYRKMLYGQIGINTSKASWENVTAVFSFLIGGGVVRVSPIYPAHVLLFAGINLALVDTTLLLAIMQQIVPAGVEVLGIIYQDETTGPSFAYAGGSDGAGYGTVVDPSVGGGYSAFI